MNFLVADLLKIHTPHHSQIQWLVKNYFSRSGYEARTEKQVWPKRKSRIDVFAQKGNYTIGVEVDDCTIRINSIEKLNALKPSLAVFVLKGHKYNWKKTYARFKYLKVKSLVVHLQSGQHKWIYPQEKKLYKINESADFKNKRKISKCQDTSLKNSNGATIRPVSGSGKTI
jgi:hypothetical protein